MWATRWQCDPNIIHSTLCLLMVFFKDTAEYNLSLICAMLTFTFFYGKLCPRQIFQFEFNLQTWLISSLQWAKIIVRAATAKFQPVFQTLTVSLYCSLFLKGPLEGASCLELSQETTWSSYNDDSRLPPGPGPFCDTFIALSTAPQDTTSQQWSTETCRTCVCVYVWLVSFTQTEHLALTSHL